MKTIKSRDARESGGAADPLGNRRARPARGRRLVRLLATVIVVTAGCARPGAIRPDVLLIVVDTLRADHCSVNGYRRPTTPNLERIAAGGVVFETAYAPVGATGPSHATLFTARYPLGHGIVRNGLPLAPRHPTLPRLLRRRGYRTAAFVSSFALARRFGFAAGFDHYDDVFDAAASTYRFRTWGGHTVEHGFDRSPAETTRAALAWLADQDGAKPLFLWVHYFDPHAPFQPPAEYAGRFLAAGQDDVERTVALYDAEIAYTDHEIGRLVDAFTRRGRETLLIITADHGEALWDRGWRGHNRSTYEFELRVPLIVRWDGQVPRGRRVAQPAHLVDIVPTVADALGLAPDGIGSDGVDLMPFIRGERPPDAERLLFVQRPLYANGKRKYGQRGPGYGVRRGRWKYFEARDDGQQALYDVVSDPHERKNLARARPHVATELAQIARAWWAAQDAAMADGQPPLPPDVIEGLDALGYVEPEPDEIRGR